jgi:hypothetical protein
VDGNEAINELLGRPHRARCGQKTVQIAVWVVVWSGWSRLGKLQQFCQLT